MARASRGGRNGLSGLPPDSTPQTARRALLAVAAGYRWWSSGGEGREIRALPPAQRQSLYRRTMENLTTICDPAPGRSMREFCRAQAALALEFPECDYEC